MKPLLLALALLCCTGNLDELDACGDLAAAYCDRLVRCGEDLDEGDCRDGLASRCSEAGAETVRDPGACARALQSSCEASLPASCTGLATDLACNLCARSEAPGEALRSACCALDPLAAVCGGCGGQG